MKRITLLLATAAIVLAMMSCDKLKEPYIVESIVEESDTLSLTASDTVNFDGKRVTLLEDYTGVKCNNCPAAAEIAQQLQEQNEGHLVVLGVHPKTPLQSPAGGFPDFRTDDGQVWNTDFNITAYPSGLVNRTGGVLGAAQWTTAVNSFMGADAPVRLIVKTNYFDSDRTLQISVHQKFLRDIESNNLRLTVCMMEDSIVGMQTTPDGVIEEYMHRHVFRGTADGQTWGRVLNGDGKNITAGTNIITNMKFKVSDEYNAENFYIVAFISDYNTDEVLMAAETKIK
jgi:hypothetical protein